MSPFNAASLLNFFSDRFGRGRRRRRSRRRWLERVAPKVGGHHRHHWRYAIMKMIRFTYTRRIQIWINAGFRRNSGWTLGELLTISKPNPYPKSEKPPARKGFTKSYLWNPFDRFDGTSRKYIGWLERLAPEVGGHHGHHRRHAIMERIRYTYTSSKHMCVRRTSD